MQLKPKNWEKFQHYKDRCPPWIKLHRDLLNDRAFMLLPTASKALAPLFWLLASESKLKDGTFDASDEELEFRLRISIKEIQQGRKSLIDKGFFVDASTMLADCLQPAIPEGETEGETETEGEQLSNDSCLSGTPRKALPDCPHQKILNLYAEHLPHLAQHRSWDGDRQDNLRARWREAAKPSGWSEGYSDEEGGLKFWGSLLAYIANDTTLAKGFHNRQTGRTWMPDLSWIVKPTNFQKIVDGKYELQEAEQKPRRAA